MKKVSFLVGLPGSGKTHYLEAHASEYTGYLKLDDPSVFQNRASMLEVIALYSKIVVADPLLCRKVVREVAMEMFKDFEQTWIFFENSPIPCMTNICYRMDSREISPNFIRSLSRGYEIPEGSTVLPVFRREV